MNKRLIFIHIPKNAGSTLSPVLRRQFPASSILSIYHDIQQQLKAFKTSEQKEKDGYQLIMGHIPFGLHSYYPEGECTYISFLRDPVKRIVSHYHYVKSRPYHPFHDIPGALENLCAYIEKTQSPEMNNGQLRLMTDQEHLPFGEINEERYEQSMELIDAQYSFMGITESFFDSMLLLQDTFGFKNVAFANKNVGKTRPRELTREERDLIMHYNHWDAKLYEKQLASFREKVTGIEQYDAKKNELLKRNNIYQKRHKILSSIKSVVKKFY